ncbi:unnamed protein product [Cuscuta campestris]|uniref:Uncharacterized protein n=1 Tax=Cuscuta campestris TaxID=132261 RepID=A0A484M8T9_9ASTE|nr:unnamed protein product [Cuscuta campestris]
MYEEIIDLSETLFPAERFRSPMRRPEKHRIVNGEICRNDLQEDEPVKDATTDAVEYAPPRHYRPRSA